MGPEKPVAAPSKHMFCCILPMAWGGGFVTLTFSRFFLLSSFTASISACCFCLLSLRASSSAMTVASSAAVSRPASWAGAQTEGRTSGTSGALGVVVGRMLASGRITESSLST